MTTPEKLTPEFVRGQISFHEAGAAWYLQHGQIAMAEWSKAQASEWRLKLSAMLADEPSDRWE